MSIALKLSNLWWRRGESNPSPFPSGNADKSTFFNFKSFKEISNLISEVPLPNGNNIIYDTVFGCQNGCQLIHLYLSLMPYLFLMHLLV